MVIINFVENRIESVYFPVPGGKCPQLFRYEGRPVRRPGRFQPLDFGARLAPFPSQEVNAHSSLILLNLTVMFIHVILAIKSIHVDRSDFLFQDVSCLKTW